MQSIRLVFFFKQKTAYEIMPSLVGSEMCIRDRVMTLKDALKAYNLCTSALEELDTFIELYGNKCDLSLIHI
ncbi:hypothetical protein CDFC105_43999 [Clostridioides difficile]|nr:hypothetical protein CDFC105_43999 [Clostridioides difficile]